MKPLKVAYYKGVEMRQNPLTGDWLIDLHEPYGAYAGTRQGMKEVINRFYQYDADAWQKTEIEEIA